MNVGQELKKGFAILLEKFGGKILLHNNFNCDNGTQESIIGMKNSKKENSTIIIFQFSENFNIEIGDVLQQENCRDFWKVYKLEVTL